MNEVKLHSDAGARNAESLLMYKSKLFCGSINKHGM